jgi:hypothetical protein
MTSDYFLFLFSFNFLSIRFCPNSFNKFKKIKKTIQLIFHNLTRYYKVFFNLFFTTLSNIKKNLI